MRRAWLLIVLLGCKRAPTESSPPPPSTSSPSPTASASAVPMVDAAAHIALLEEVAAVYAKRPACDQLERQLAPLRAKMSALGDVADPRLGRAIESDEVLRARRGTALDTIMDGAMRCRPKT